MDNMYFPAEWEPQRLIQLTWPHAATDWKDYLNDITETFIALAQVITRHEGLLIVTPDVEDTRSKLAMSLTPEEMAQVTFFECPTNDTWARDHAALTLIDRENATTTPLLLDFRFNGWGEKFPAQLDNAITRHLAEGGLFQVPLEDHEDFVLEGGSVESDGKGTVFTTAQCLLAPHRNQPLTIEEIEEQLKLRLRADRIVWLHHGNLVGDDTDGHIDTIVRCAPDDTLLYVCCEDESDEQFADFQMLQEELRMLRTPEGEPYRLLPLPMPDAIYEEGDRLPATYANFVILNGAVIVPTYAQSDNDARALSIIQQAFPDHAIIGRLTMQFPKQLTINTHTS